MILAVRSDVAPLAANQFPKAEVLSLTLRGKRRILNVTTVNILHSLPAWLRMATLRVDAAICLRSMRAYLHTIFFYTPRAARRIACVNLLLASPRVRRPAVERFVSRFFRPLLLPYPEAGALPTDLEANRVVTAALLEREVGPEEILPQLVSAGNTVRDGWILCPFSSSQVKDYPATSWASALQLLASERGRTPLRLIAGPDQQSRLQKFAEVLRSLGLDALEIAPPEPLPVFVQRVAQSRLVLTVDTAAAHIACALGTPAVIVSAGHHPGVYAPYSPNGLQTWLVPPLAHPKGTWRDAISPETIAAAVRKILERAV